MSTTYKTIQGDTWDKIAYKYYPDIGGEKLMHKLLEANIDYRNRVVFEAGVILVIPDIDIPVTSLPPWRRRA